MDAIDAANVKRNGGKIMAKNLIPQVAQMLGVAIGEEFKIKGYDDSNTRTYKFTTQGLRVKLVEHPEATEFNALAAFNSLLVGDIEIVKLPWKPKKDEDYYTFGGSDGIWRVSQQHWTCHPFDLAVLAKGWVFHTREEAESALPKVAAEMGVKFI